MKNKLTDNKIMNKKVVIVGAGLSGLICGKILSEKGLNVTILEKQKIVGGLASGIREHGFSMDIGPHYMVLPKKSSITEEIYELLGKDNLLDFPKFKQSHKVYFSGKIIDKFPSLKNIIKNLGINISLKIILEILVLSFRKKIQGDNSITGKEYLVNNFGNILYKNWFKFYYSNIFLDENLPKEFVKKQFPSPGLKKILKFSTIHKENHTVRERNEYFDCYPKFGMNDLIDKIKKQIIVNGGEIILDAEIKSISHEKNEKKIIFLKDNKTLELNSNVIVYGISPSLALKWFENIPQEVFIDIKKTSSYNSVIIYLFIDSKNLFDGWIINIHDPDLIFSRISQQSFLSRYIAPEGKSLLTIEIKCNSYDEIWKMDENKILKLVKNDLKKMNFFDLQKIYDHKIIRVPRVYPKYDTIEFNDQNLVNYINSFENEFALSHEFDSSELITETKINSDEKIEYRLGGILIAISSAHLLVKKILKD